MNSALLFPRPRRRFLLWPIVLATGLALALLPLRWLVIAVPGVVVVGATLIRPQLALYLLCFAIPFGSLYEVNLGGITVGVTEGLIGLLMAAWIARSIALRETDWTWPRLSGPLALFIGATLLSLLNVTSLPFALKEIAKWVEFLGVMLYVANAVNRRQSTLVISCLLLAGVAQALLGAYQFVTQSGPEFFSLGRFMRAYGTFEQPNPYAGYLGLTAPLALALALSLLEKHVPTTETQTLRTRSIDKSPAGASIVHSHTAQPSHPAHASVPAWLGWLALGSFGAISAAIGMSWSRGGWLAFGTAFAAVNVIRSRRGALAFATSITLVAVIGLLGSFRLLPESIAQRLTSFIPFVGVRDVRSIEVTDDNYASVERLAHWEAALDMWRDRPWLGVGFGNYEAAYAKYALPKWPMALGHAHNYYLNVAAETGVIGLIAYLALWAVALWQTGQAIRKTDDPYIKALALGALGTLVHVSVHNVVDNLWVHNTYIHVAIVLGLVYARPPVTE